MERNYESINFSLSEQEHKYGGNIHLISDPVLISLLARLCSPKTYQPNINDISSYIYTSMVKIVINCEFPTQQVSIDTRMKEYHKEGFYHGEIIDPNTKIVVVDLARAGVLPSLVSYNYLNTIMNPKNIRQDHIFINRAINEKEEVIGTNLTGHKIGGDIQDSTLLFPDPMGATGSSISDAVNVYKKNIAGNVRKYIALHLIITPEYIQHIKKHHPDLIVYALRLDRGLSDPEVLKTIPGTHPDKEKGLNEKQYIVPGGGGFGEIMNNSFV